MGAISDLAWRPGAESYREERRELDEAAHEFTEVGKHLMKRVRILCSHTCNAARQVEDEEPSRKRSSIGVRPKPKPTTSGYSGCALPLLRLLEERGRLLRAELEGFRSALEVHAAK